MKESIVKPQVIIPTVTGLALTFVLAYALTHANDTALRWWAGLATAMVPTLSIIAYWLGRTEARGHVAGLTQGIDAVSKAAANTTDVAQRAANIRVDTANRMRPAPAVQQMFLPPAVIGGGQGVILPPLQATGDTEA